MCLYFVNEADVSIRTFGLECYVTDTSHIKSARYIELAYT